MGVFYEWYPMVFRLVQALAPKGSVGIAHVEEFTTNAMNEWLQQPDRKKQFYDEEGGDILVSDVLSSLLAKHQSSSDNFTKADAHYHVIPNVLAGGHTTGASFTAIMRSLMKDSRVLGKLRLALKEMNWELQGGYVSVKQAYECEYLQAVIKEGMRLFSTAGKPLTRVIPKGGLEIAGRFFPEGVRSIPLPDSSGPGLTLS